MIYFYGKSCYLSVLIQINAKLKNCKGLSKKTPCSLNVISYLLEQKCYYAKF